MQPDDETPPEHLGDRPPLAPAVAAVMAAQAGHISARMAVTEADAALALARNHGGPVSANQPYTVAEYGPDHFVPMPPSDWLPLGDDDD